MPTTPHSAAGWRIDPPVSEPSASGAKPAATAAAEPPLLPPGTLLAQRGLRAGPKAEFSVELPMANSSMFVLPTATAPAARSRATTVASYGGRQPSRIFDPQLARYFVSLSPELRTLLYGPYLAALERAEALAEAGAGVRAPRSARRARPRGPSTAACGGAS